MVKNILFGLLVLAVAIFVARDLHKNTIHEDVVGVVIDDVPVMGGDQRVMVVRVDDDIHRFSYEIGSDWWYLNRDYLGVGKCALLDLVQPQRYRFILFDYYNFKAMAPCP